jgi:hypothetical protein
VVAHAGLVAVRLLAERVLYRLVVAGRWPGAASGQIMIVDGVLVDVATHPGRRRGSDLRH